MYLTSYMYIHKNRKVNVMLFVIERGSHPSKKEKKKEKINKSKE